MGLKGYVNFSICAGIAAARIEASLSRWRRATSRLNAVGWTYYVITSFTTRSSTVRVLMLLRAINSMAGQFCRKIVACVEPGQFTFESWVFMRRDYGRCIFEQGESAQASNNAATASRSSHNRVGVHSLADDEEGDIKPFRIIGDSKWLRKQRRRKSTGGNTRQQTSNY
jgi:hypothetical protein